MNRYDELTPPEQAEADAVINAMASGASFRRVTRLAPMILEESLVSSRDDWHQIGLPGDHPIPQMFRDAATVTISIVDRYGDTRLYRRSPLPNDRTL